MARPDGLVSAHPFPRLDVSTKMNDDRALFFMVPVVNVVPYPWMEGKSDRFAAVAIPSRHLLYPNKGALDFLSLSGN